MSDDRVKMDAIVVGGGPAGLTAAHTMASAGLEVALIERGEYCGAKNVGGLVYGTVLTKLIPDACSRAPIERPVSRRRIVFLGDGETASLEFGREAWSRPPFNHTYIVHRSQFDRWLSKEVEGAGANLIEGTVAEGLIYETRNGRKQAVGVKVQDGEEFYADSIILADGANCVLTDQVSEDLGLNRAHMENNYAVGVKEIIGLPRGVIEDRFNLDPHEGMAIDFLGVPFDGVVGGGFLYTAGESLHLGFAARIETLAHAGITPNELMERFRQHPSVRRLVQGGELLEYSAHMIPEGGYDALPDLAGDGVMVAGDAAGLVNMSLYKEGTNHAMESGWFAGQTAVEAKKKGDFSREALLAYPERMRGGVSMKDLKRFRKAPFVLENTPNLLSLYPKKVVRMINDWFSVGYEPKTAIQKRAFKTFMSGLPKFKFIRDALRARHLA